MFSEDVAFHASRTGFETAFLDDFELSLSRLMRAAVWIREVGHLYAEARLEHSL
jgi:hypothetical protein